MPLALSGSCWRHQPKDESVSTPNWDWEKRARSSVMSRGDGRVLSRALFGECETPAFAIVFRGFP